MEDHLNFFGNGRQHFLFLMENDLNILDNGRKPLKKNNATFTIETMVVAPLRVTYYFSNLGNPRMWLKISHRER